MVGPLTNTVILHPARRTCDGLSSLSRPTCECMNGAYNNVLFNTQNVFTTAVSTLNIQFASFICSFLPRFFSYNRGIFLKTNTWVSITGILASLRFEVFTM
jgi:hypothetical protein